LSKNVTLCDATLFNDGSFSLCVETAAEGVMSTIALWFGFPMILLVTLLLLNNAALIH
jgi:hypothetical protein